MTQPRYRVVERFNRSKSRLVRIIDNETDDVLVRCVDEWAEILCEFMNRYDQTPDYQVTQKDLH